MAKVVVSLELGDRDDENLRDDKARLEQSVDMDIGEFDEYFQKVLGNDPMVKGERAIIKTFLYYHLVHKKAVDASG